MVGKIAQHGLCRIFGSETWVMGDKCRISVSEDTKSSGVYGSVLSFGHVFFPSASRGEPPARGL